MENFQSTSISTLDVDRYLPRYKYSNLGSKTRKVIASMRLSKNVAEQTIYRDLLSKIFCICDVKNENSKIRMFRSSKFLVSGYVTPSSHYLFTNFAC